MTRSFPCIIHCHYYHHPHHSHHPWWEFVMVGMCWVTNIIIINIIKIVIFSFLGVCRACTETAAEKWGLKNKNLFQKWAKIKIYIKKLSFINILIWSKLKKIVTCSKTWRWVIWYKNKFLSSSLLMFGFPKIQYRPPLEFAFVQVPQNLFELYVEEIFSYLRYLISISLFLLSYFFFFFFLISYFSGAESSNDMSRVKNSQGDIFFDNSR